ncbi:hypothetical protein Tco_0573003 [Tanacetum coccineum]
MENDQKVNVEEICWGGHFYFSLSDDEESDVQFVSQTTSNFTNVTNMAKKQKATSNGNKAAKKKEDARHGAQLEGINHSFQMFVQGFNANFRTMANAVANAMTDDNNRKKAKSEQLKDVLNWTSRLAMYSMQLRYLPLIKTNLTYFLIFATSYDSL